MAKIELIGVSYVYGKGTPFEKLALDNVNAVFEDNRINGLIGHTGCGKSTLVQLLNGLLVPTEGKVLIDGRDVNEKGADRRALRFRVGLVFQYPEYQLFEETVLADVSFGPKNMGLGAGEINDRVRRALRFVGLGDDVLTVSPFDLSGGQKRRVAIAGIMAMEPEVLILDEPAAGLDPAGRADILGGVRRYQRQRGANVIIVSHSMEDMAEYSDVISVMDHGKVVASDAPGRIFSDADGLRRVGLDVPQITRVMRRIRERGVPVDDTVYNVVKAAREISGLFPDGGRDA
ncbi:MAG: energy-coupling factor transporter ATPase [Clostridia bacterium]|nr:energy-coupling factor transporter ATPase [Clostridia bacterium]MBR5767975.1 energy-coupling factor transporter ATPase [Clostridia bacterium]